TAPSPRTSSASGASSPPSIRNSTPSRASTASDIAGMPTAARPPRLRAGLRLKLLVAASVLLLIPLLGVLYVRELEHLVLRVQEQGLVSTARAVGTALNDRPSLFRSGEVYPFALAPESDLKVDNLPAPIKVDGLDSDWEALPMV